MELSKFPAELSCDHRFLIRSSRVRVWVFRALFKRVNRKSRRTLRGTDPIQTLDSISQLVLSGRVHGLFFRELLDHILDNSEARFIVLFPFYIEILLVVVLLGLPGSWLNVYSLLHTENLIEQSHLQLNSGVWAMVVPPVILRSRQLQLKLVETYLLKLLVVKLEGRVEACDLCLANCLAGQLVAVYLVHF